MYTAEAVDIASFSIYSAGLSSEIMLSPYVCASPTMGLSFAYQVNAHILSTEDNVCREKRI